MLKEEKERRRTKMLRVSLKKAGEKDFDKRFQNYLRNKKKMTQQERDHAHEIQPDFDVYQAISPDKSRNARNNN